MFARFESLQDMIRWSLVEQDYEKDIFAETAWQPQLAILAVLTEFMRRRIASGELVAMRKSSRWSFWGSCSCTRSAVRSFPARCFTVVIPMTALRFYIDVFLNGVRNVVMDTREVDQQKTVAEPKGTARAELRSETDRLTSGDARSRPRRRIIFSIVVAIVIVVALIWGIAVAELHALA